MSRARMALLLAAWTLAGCAAVVETVPGVAGVAIRVERDLNDPSGAATGIRVGQCGAGFDVMIAVPDLAALDRMVDAGGGGAGGMYDVGGQELFVGSIEAAAVAFGGNALFIGKRGDSWIRTGPGRLDSSRPSRRRGAARRGC